MQRVLPMPICNDNSCITRYWVLGLIKSRAVRQHRQGFFLDDLLIIITVSGVLTLRPSLNVKYLLAQDAQASNFRPSGVRELI
jgi:hypothetical protein